MGWGMAHEAPRMTEFSDSPAVLVLADSEAGEARARRSVESAGCRVVAKVAVADGPDRIARQAGLSAVWVELEQDDGGALDAILGTLQQRAQQGQGSVVAAPADLIDLIAARAPHALVQHLCGADELERVAAIAAVAAPRKHRFHDVSREQGLPRLQQLSEEAGRIAAALAALSEREQRAERVRLGQAEESGPPPIDAGAVRAMIRARRLRDQYLGGELFADPAWDIMLDLYAAQLEKQRVAVSSLCIAAAVPATTGLRWIKTLTDSGLLVRSADPQDGRRVYIELAPETAAALEAYLRAAQRISPLML